MIAKVSVRTVHGSGGSGTCASTATVGMSGPHTNACTHAVCWLATRPRRNQQPNPCAGSAKSAHQLSLHSGSVVGSWASSSSGKGRNGSGALAAGSVASASVSSTWSQCRRSIIMNIWSPRSVRFTSIEETIAIITPKKLCRRTPSATSARVMGSCGPSASW